MTKTTKYHLFKKIFNHSPPKNNKIEKMLKRTPINQHYPSRNSYNCCCIKQSEVSSRIIFLLRISSLSEKSDNEDLVYPDGVPSEDEAEETETEDEEESELCQGLVC